MKANGFKPFKNYEDAIEQILNNNSWWAFNVVVENKYEAHRVSTVCLLIQEIKEAIDHHFQSINQYKLITQSNDYSVKEQCVFDEYSSEEESQVHLVPGDAYSDKSTFDENSGEEESQLLLVPDDMDYLEEDIEYRHIEAPPTNGKTKPSFNLKLSKNKSHKVSKKTPQKVSKKATDRSAKLNQLESRKHNRPQNFPKQTKQGLLDWLLANKHYPYPNDDVVEQWCEKYNIEFNQIKGW
jgi:hypothetical protein